MSQLIRSPEKPGRFNSRLGRDDEAEQLHRENLETRRRVLGDDHPVTLSSVGNLGNLYFRQGRYDDAEPLLVETLETRKRVLGDEHPDTLDSMNALAVLYFRQNRYDEAEPLYLESYEIRKRVIGETHGATFYTLKSLVEVLVAAGDSERARLFTHQLIEARREAAGLEDAGAGARNRYAWLVLTCEFSDLRDPDSALRFALEANEMTGFTNPGYLDTLALAYHRTGDTAKAIQTQKKALSLLPEGSPDQAEFEQRLAEYEAALKDPEE